jgi:hypothetical protein
LTQRRDWLTVTRADLREILNDWDPIGIYSCDDQDDPLPPDEYDCIRVPVISRLMSGAKPFDVASFLREERESASSTTH